MKGSFLFNLILYTVLMTSITFVLQQWSLQVGLILAIGTFAIAVKFLQISTHFNKNFGVDGLRFYYKDLNAVHQSYLQRRQKIHQKVSRIKELKSDRDEIRGRRSDLIKSYQGISQTHREVLDRLNAAQDYFERLSETVPNRIWLTDAEGIIVQCNRNCKNVNGLTPGRHFLNELIHFPGGSMDLLKRRNFSEVVLHFKDGQILTASTYRIFDDAGLEKILFASKSGDPEQQMQQNYLKKSRELHFINEIGNIVSRQSTIETTLHEILDKLSFYLNLNACTVRLINEENLLILKAMSGYSSQFVWKEPVEYENTHLGLALKEQEKVILNSKSDMRFSDKIVENPIENGKRVLYMPLTSYNKSFGVFSVVSDYDFGRETLIFIESIAINITIAIERILLYDQLKANYFKTVEAFVAATEIKEERYAGHSRRVAEICKILSEQLFSSDYETDEIFMAGLLHDVGKLAFSENNDEIETDVDRHGFIGRRMVERVGLNEDILNGIEFHHLDYDLTNNKEVRMTEQPYYAQVIRISNDFDLLMNETNANIVSVIQMLSQKSGTAYSPQFIRILNAVASVPGNALEKIYSLNREIKR